MCLRVFVCVLVFLLCVCADVVLEKVNHYLLCVFVWARTGARAFVYSGSSRLPHLYVYVGQRWFGS